MILMTGYTPRRLYLWQLQLRVNKKHIPYCIIHILCYSLWVSLWGLYDVYSVINLGTQLIVCSSCAINLNA
jgi:hypothetical protein